MTDTDRELEAIAAAEPRIRLSLFRFCRFVDTEVVVQETLLRMWQLAPRFTPDGKPDAMLRYAIRTAHNRAVSEARRSRTQNPTDLPDPTELGMIDTPHSEPELREAVGGCLKELPRRPRSAIRARLREAHVRDEVLAEGLGMTVNTFFQNIRQARLALLECLHRHGFALGIDP
ncbi:MAG: sigma-70 family RNA polymerase sigma factor [Planctomycetota bacterium]|nr:MAG: sigma-70 family RNA polymerase sigma factor [Planctomycetota bacterium]